MNSREKGKRGERQWRDELRWNGYRARRGQQFSGSADSPDVVCDDLDWLHFEVKLTERLDLYGAMAQARRDCGRTTPAGYRIPIVAHRRHFWPWLVTMEVEGFYRLLGVKVSVEARRCAEEHPECLEREFPWLAVMSSERNRMNVHEEMAAAGVWEESVVAVTLWHRRRTEPESPWLVTIEAKTFFRFLRGDFPEVYFAGLPKRSWWRTPRLFEQRHQKLTSREREPRFRRVPCHGPNNFGTPKPSDGLQPESLATKNNNQAEQNESYENQSQQQ